MKILSLSDTVIPFIYSPALRERFSGVDMVVGCGDLPYYYLEYVLNALNAPLFYVRGNHDKVVEYSQEGQRTGPGGGVDLHCRLVNCNGLLLAGIEGSGRYRPGRFQYTQQEMWGHVLRLSLGLLSNYLAHGRFLDVLVTHAPATGTHDREDLPHQGIDAFRWLVRIFRPRYHFHGHVHLYRPDTPAVSQVGPTQVINTYGFRETQVEIVRRQTAHVKPSRLGRTDHGD